MLLSINVMGQNAIEEDTTIVKTNPVYGTVEAQVITTGDRVPFWMRSLQHGSIPLNGTSFSLIGSVIKDYQPGKKSALDWGGGLMLRTNLGAKAEAILVEAYAKVKFKQFEFRAGRSRAVYGLMDTSLGSGSFAVAGNALGIPQIGISVPDYSFPIFDSLLSFKGNYTQGWLGETPVNILGTKKQLSTFYHQKSLHMRMGKPDWRVKGIVGIVHHVYWNNGKEMWGDAYTLTPFQTYIYVVTGTNYTYKPGQNIDATSNVGNHIGSIDLGLEISGKSLNTFLYHQVLYESENSFKNGSLSDGLTGISISNPDAQYGGFQFRKLVLEYFRTVDQAYTPTRPYNYDSYFNHEFIINGNSYRGTGVGNPFITRRTDMVSSLPTGDYRNFFTNTRLTLFHAGLQFSVNKFLITTRVSSSRNLGVYESVSNFPPSSQLSASLEAAVLLKNRWQLRGMFAFDNGELLYNTSGGYISLARSF